MNTDQRLARYQTWAPYGHNEYPAVGWVVCTEGGVPTSFVVTGGIPAGQKNPGNIWQPVGAFDGILHVAGQTVTPQYFPLVNIVNVSGGI